MISFWGGASSDSLWSSPANKFVHFLSNESNNRKQPRKGRGGTVDIELTDKQGFVVLKVYDSGAGVPEDHLEKIFDRFFQVDQSRQRTNHRGNGLGLSICKSIIEQHGGTIEAKNGSLGLIVRVQLPAVSL